MNIIYQVNIHGRTLENRDLKKLLARAVSVKRNINRGVQSEGGLAQDMYMEGAQIGKGSSVAVSCSRN